MVCVTSHTVDWYISINLSTYTNTLLIGFIIISVTVRLFVSFL